MENKFLTFDFFYPKVIKYCDDLKTIKDKLAYLEWIKYKYRIKPDIINPWYEGSLEEEKQYDIYTKGEYVEEKPFLEKIQALIDYYKSLDVGDIESTETKPDECSESESNFTHSDLFRWISCNGTEYSFTDRQGEVVQRLYECYQEGIMELSSTEIFSELPDDKNVPQMKDVFKDHPAWNNLIVKGKKKGSYRLNIDQAIKITKKI